LLRYFRCLESRMGKRCLPYARNMSRLAVMYWINGRLMPDFV
jgi:hypothetical protein